MGALVGHRFSTVESRLHMLVSHPNVAMVRVEADELPDALFRSFLRTRLIEKSLELADLLQVDLLFCDVS